MSHQIRVRDEGLDLFGPYFDDKGAAQAEVAMLIQALKTDGMAWIECFGEIEGATHSVLLTADRLEKYRFMVFSIQEAECSATD